MNSEKLYFEIVQNHVDLLKALQSQIAPEILRSIKTSTDTLFEIAEDIIKSGKKQKPIETLELMPGNINGPYVNLPAHTSTVDLLSRMSLCIDGQIYDEMDIKLISQCKRSSYSNTKLSADRNGGYYILMKNLK